MTTEGTKQHYLPACIIGRFSFEQEKRLRERRVFVLGRGKNKIFTQKPENLCMRRGMYDLREYGGTIDEWQYEDQLPDVLKKIENNIFPELDTFIHVLVPYVTCLFMRGVDYELRQENIQEIRKLQSDGLISEDNVNGSRMMHLQRLLAIVAAAQWTYRKTEGSLILPDTGLCIGHNGDKPAWLVPVGPNSLFEITPRKIGRIASWDASNKAWLPRWKFGSLNKGEVSELNVELQRQAYEWCFSDDEGLFTLPYKKLSKSKKASLMENVMRIDQCLTTHERVAHEFEWYSLSVIAAGHLSPLKVSRMNLNHFTYYPDKDRWTPSMPMFPDNLKPFKSGIHVDGRKLVLDLRCQDILF